MSERISPPRVLIALDIDGVLNRLPRNGVPGEDTRIHITDSAPCYKGPSFPGHDEGACTIGGYLIQWYPEIIDRLRAILLRPDVEAVWLTTWLAHLPRIRELEQALRLTGERDAEPLVKHLALHPIANWRSEAFPKDISLMPSPKWWKHYAAAELRERIQPQKFAWLDDDLGREKDPAGIWQPQETDELLLLPTSAASGLTAHNLDQLEHWIDRD